MNYTGDIEVPSDVAIGALLRRRNVHVGDWSDYSKGWIENREIHARIFLVHYLFTKEQFKDYSYLMNNLYRLRDDV